MTPVGQDSDGETGTGSAEVHQRKRRRSLPLTAIGLVLLIAGLSCLGWVAYQFFGTNVVSRQAFNQEKVGLRTKWSTEPKDVDNVKSQRPRAIPGDAIALLRIPAFGAGFEVPILAGTDLDTLDRGVGHYDQTADPGALGNFAVAGHRVTHGQPFARMLELDKGDEVIVETRAAVYTYVLDLAPRDLTVNATANWVLDPVPGRPGAKPARSLITLTTCQDLFHSPDRSIGFGHLQSTTNKP